MSGEKWWMNKVMLGQNKINIELKVVQIWLWLTKWIAILSLSNDSSILLKSPHSYAILCISLNICFCKTILWKSIFKNIILTIYNSLSINTNQIHIFHEQIFVLLWNSSGMLFWPNYKASKFSLKDKYDYKHKSYLKIWFNC